MDVSRYHAQLVRYYEIFPRDRIHVFLFDDLKRSTVDAVQGVYRFLAIDSAFVPDLETAHNVGGVPASHALGPAKSCAAMSRWSRLGSPGSSRTTPGRTIRNRWPSADLSSRKGTPAARIWRRVTMPDCAWADWRSAAGRSTCPR